MFQDISIFLEAVVICEQSNHLNSSSLLPSPGIFLEDFIFIRMGTFEDSNLYLREMWPIFLSFFFFLKISLRTKHTQSSLISEIGVPCSQKKNTALKGL